jgi:hypothetical protein
MSTELDWNESYYFNLFDAKEGLTAFMRIGNKPNRDEKSVFLFVMNKNGIFGLRNTEKCDENRTMCSGLRFEEKDGVWKITYNGPLFDMSKEPAPIMSSLDLTWDPVNPLMDYHDCVDAHGAALSSKTASEHFEQFGVVSGKITVGDCSFDVDATGERDKSEGVRDWGSPKMWLWLNSVYGKDLGWNATKLSTEMGDVDAGYVGTKDSNDPIVKISADLQYNDGMPSGYKMTMTGKSGKVYQVDAKILKSAQLPMQGSKDMMLIETISQTTMDGRVGFGIAEFLIPAKND